MTDDSATLLLALLRTPGIGPTLANRLCHEAGGVTALWQARHHVADAVPQASAHLQQCLTAWPAHLQQAQHDTAEARARHIMLLTQADAAYPAWLKSQADAPPVLFYRGSAPLNAPHMVSIVGTRHISEYGKDLCQHIVSGLAACLPHVSIVSGLAYGVDVCAHRAALRCGLPTIGVLAHGLNHLYPASHRDTANRMVSQGGLLTEYACHVPVSRENFVQRNRIVAALSPVCIVVESARRGGALITARMALDAGREVYACPGRLTDTRSEGCNRLIATQQAALFTSVDDLLSNLGWATATADRPAAPQQLELFPTLSPTEERLRSILAGAESCSPDELVAATGIRVAEVNAALVHMEMTGLVRTLAGNRYRWTGPQ